MNLIAFQSIFNFQKNFLIPNNFNKLLAFVYNIKLILDLKFVNINNYNIFNFSSACKTIICFLTIIKL